MDVGYESGGDNGATVVPPANSNDTNVTTDINDGSQGAGNGDNIDDLGDKTNQQNQDNQEGAKDGKGDGNEGTSTLEVGSSIEFDGTTYTVAENGDIVDEKGEVFKEAANVAEWLKEVERVDDNADTTITIDSVIDAIGIEVTDEAGKPVEFENTIEGIRGYINSVLEVEREENMATAIESLYERYPIVEDVLNYYIANGNSLEGFGEVKDRSNIVIDDANEAQQISIVKTVWEEQGRKGNLEAYIQYLKSSNTLAAVAKEELAGLQESDKQRREELAAEAEKAEQERLESNRKYWEGVKQVIDKREIAGYSIPDTIIVNREGKKLSVTPEDFFNYVHRVDQHGRTAYSYDLEKETPESRRDDELLRAYLKFVGGNYSNLVDMAVNKDKVKALRLKAKTKPTSQVRITKPTTTTKDKLDLGF